MMRRIGLALLWAAVLAGCAHQAPPAQVQVAGGMLLFDGMIMPESADRFLAALDAHTIDRVAIVSGGGEVTAAIRMARAIHRRGLDVHVVGACFSSCANYIFPAGKRKHIAKGGLVAWHGNIRHMLYRHQRGEKKLDAAALASSQRTAALEAAFFKEIGVDEFLCWVGKLPPYSAHNLYFLDLPDMARFGVREVSASPGYADSGLQRYNTGSKVTIPLVRIDWETLQRPAPAVGAPSPALPAPAAAR